MQILFRDIRQYRVVFVAIAFLTGLIGAAGLPSVGSTMNDSFISIFITSAFFLALKSLSLQSTKKQYVVICIAGLIAGVGTGLKLIVGIYNFAIFIALLFYQPPNVRHIIIMFLFCTFTLIGFALSLGHWMYKLYLLYENPLFPMFNKYIQSPYMDSSGAMGIVFNKDGILGLITLPFKLLVKDSGTVGELRVRDYHLFFVFVLSTITAIMFLIRKLTPNKSDSHQSLIEDKYWGFCFAFFTFSYIAWGLSSAIYRYAIPLELLTGPLIVYCSIKIFNSLKIALIAALSVFLTISATLHKPNWGHTTFGEKYFEITFPAIEDDSLIIMAGRKPMAYLVPFGNPTVRYISVFNNFRHYKKQDKLQIEMNELIQTHNNPIYIMLHKKQGRRILDKELKELLDFYALSINEENCQPILSNIDKNSIILCSAPRIGNQP